MFRRWIVLFAIMSTSAVVIASGSPASAENRKRPGPPSVSPADIRFTHQVLRPRRPNQVGLQPEQVQRMRADIERYLLPRRNIPDTRPTRVRSFSQPRTA